MHKSSILLLVGFLISGGMNIISASPALLKEHCSKCHNDQKAKGKFKLSALGETPDAESLQGWLDALDLVTAKEMPPEDEGELSSKERSSLINYFKDRLEVYETLAHKPQRLLPRRLNNREFANSVRDVLMIEDVGTHHPTANLIGDALHDGFDTHGETLGFSKFHLEQYIEAVRKIVDVTILSGDKPEAKRYDFSSREILEASTSQNTKRAERRGTRQWFDFRDPRSFAYFEGLKTMPATGHYKISIRCTGKDRFVYESSKTGVYHGDPIRMSVHLGDREKVFDLPDEDQFVVELEEWVAAGSRLRLHHPTDGLRERSNGNFKFQYAIGGEYLKKHDPVEYRKVVAGISKGMNARIRRKPESWHHWVNHWQGPRPVVYGATAEGPFFKSWPPERQVALIGKDPKVSDASAILRPIAERAFRREVSDGELQRFVDLANAKADALSDVEALKEGIVSILVSPAFLLLNTDEVSEPDRFASKLSYFLGSTIPDRDLRAKAANGALGNFNSVRAEIQAALDREEANPFLKAFPTAWLELNDINFMAPDPDQYRFYHRKRVSEDMVNEALHFFRHAVNENIPVTEFLSADYSFINADLARVYGVEDVAPDSRFRKYTFKDGRRGGILGMSAFLTATADSLSTSPIHRAIYVMENLLGIHPSPPPPDVVITEPDVRQAKTIKEILNAHQSDPNCAACHKSIDPFGYAFENFDPTGAWRSVYVAPEPMDAVPAKAKNRRKADPVTIPIDASAKFRNGAEYQDIVGYRKQLMTDANRDRFVRCFISKLLTYANGAEPEEGDFAEIEKILKRSAKRDYRVVDTIAAVVDSPLFRER